MRRIFAITALLVAVSVIAVAGTGASSGGSYKVRAVFDNAAAVIPGEDVKIAGVKVGKISGLNVTKDQKAGVTLDITLAGFQDFRADAHCTIRPQSLIGEKFVECTPTQPRAVGQPEAPSLPKIKSGDGKGEHLLTVDHTSTPVDIDLINNILRKPYAQRLSLIVNELGTGLAGRGADLQQVIRRANPALQQTDRVLAILAKQNKVLADLATNSDQILAPLARERVRVADSIVQSGAVAQATAERSADLQRTIQKLPIFLRRLRPTMRRLGGLSDQAAPVFEDLGREAPSINAFIRQLGPFSAAALPSLRTLGEAAKVGGPALKAAHPTIRLLRTFARNAKPLSTNLAALTDSFQKTGGVERLLDYIFYQVAAVNGFDQFGHYLRAGLVVNLCSTYALTPQVGCSANFAKATGSSARLSSGDRKTLIANAAALAGRRPATVGSAAKGRTAAGGKDAGTQQGALKLPQITLPGRLGQALGAPQQGQSAIKAPTQLPGTGTPVAGADGTQAKTAGASSAQAGLLDYLLGSG